MNKLIKELIVEFCANSISSASISVALYFLFNVGFLEAFLISLASCYLVDIFKTIKEERNEAIF